MRRQMGNVYVVLTLVAFGLTMLLVVGQDSVQIKTKNASNSDTARLLVSTGANTADLKVNNANLWLLKNTTESYPLYFQANNGSDISMGLKFNTAGGTNRIAFLNNSGTEVLGISDAGNLTTSGTINAGSLVAGAATIGGSPVLTQASVFSGDVGGFYNNLQLVANSVGAQEISDGSISASETTGTFITAGTGISATNTGTSWNITNTGVTSFNGSGGAVTGVTSVGANSPLSSSGGTTPVISLTGTVGIANGGTNNTTYSTSQFLWFDGSQIVASGYGASSFISGSGTTNYVPKFTGASTIGSSQIFDNGTAVGVGTATPNGKFDVNGIIYAFPSATGTLPTLIDAGSRFRLRQDSLYSGTPTAPGTVFDGFNLEVYGTTFGDMSFYQPSTSAWAYWNYGGTRYLRIVPGTTATNMYLGTTASPGTYNTSGADVAEEFSYSGTLAEGDLVVVDSTGTSEVKKCTVENSDVFGIVSTNPGVLLNSLSSASLDAQLAQVDWNSIPVNQRAAKRAQIAQQWQADRRATHLPLALNGRTPCNVDATSAPINKGDYLTSSANPGFAKKLAGAGNYFAIALESKASGTGKIMVAIVRGYKAQ